MKSSIRTKVIVAPRSPDYILWHTQRRNLMKRIAIILTAAVALVSLAAWLNAADEKPWLDMKNCDFCKNLLKDPHLL
jgi:hypothetical protein